MIIRIVKMTFKPEMVSDFLMLFEANKNLISSFEGCSFLELLSDKNNSNTYFTYSKWDDEKYLEAYRNSALFEKVWGKTKVLFAEQPEAWSLTQH